MYLKVRDLDVAVLLPMARLLSAAGLVDEACTVIREVVRRGLFSQLDSEVRAWYVESGLS